MSDEDPQTEAELAAYYNETHDLSGFEGGEVVSDPQTLADTVMRRIREAEPQNQEAVERVMVETLTGLGFTVTRNDAGGFSLDRPDR